MIISLAIPVCLFLASPLTVSDTPFLVCTDTSSLTAFSRISADGKNYVILSDTYGMYTLYDGDVFSDCSSSQRRLFWDWYNGPGHQLVLE